MLHKLVEVWSCFGRSGITKVFDWKHKEVICEFVWSLTCFSWFLPLLEVFCSSICIVFALRVLKLQGVSFWVRFE